jgi:transglutaminase-like putative cysteine protease
VRRGVCQDLTHVFLAAARLMEIPARYVSGYLAPASGSGVDQEASHAWAEAHVPRLGWVSFDPTNGICASENYVRVAIGLDYLDAAPFRGTFSGPVDERLTVRVRVDPIRPSMSQSQSMGGMTQTQGFGWNSTQTQDRA